MKTEHQTIRRVDLPRNCWTCGHCVRRDLPDEDGGYECMALTLDEEIDAPIIAYVIEHCADSGDYMPIDTAPCPAWVPR